MELANLKEQITQAMAKLKKRPLKEFIARQLRELFITLQRRHTMVAAHLQKLMMHELLLRVGESLGMGEHALPPLPIRLQLSFGREGRPVAVMVSPRYQPKQDKDIAKQVERMNSYYAVLQTSFLELARTLECYSRSNEEKVYRMRDMKLLGKLGKRGRKSNELTPRYKKTYIK